MNLSYYFKTIVKIRMEHKLKNALPNYTINNASKRSCEEIMKITELCYKKDNLLVFIERNQNNEDYFEITEFAQNTEKINLIFLNKDDVYFYYIENIDIAIMSLKRKLYNETDCVVCMEQCIDNFYICSKCGHQIHSVCFEKCAEQKCSICRYNYFMYTE